MLEHALKSFPDLSWEDCGRCLSQVKDLFDELLSDSDAFLQLFDAACSDRARREKFETDPIRTKIVLFESECSRFRLRLHFWQDDASNMVHAHRFPYAARVLAGSYVHNLYEKSSQLDDPAHRDLPMREVAIAELDQSVIRAVRSPCIYSQEIHAGATYVQGNSSLMSSSVPEKGTVSLFVRGPADSDSAFQYYLDRETVIWRRGTATIVAGEKDYRPISDAEVTRIRQWLVDYFDQAPLATMSDLPAWFDTNADR